MRDVKYNNVCRRDISSIHAAPRCRRVRRNFSLFSLPPPSLAPKFPLNDGRGREVASSSETILLDCVYIVNYLCARLFRARAKSRRICECLRDFFASLFRIIRIRSPFPSFCFLYLYHIIPSCIRSISFLNDSKFIF